MRFASLAATLLATANALNGIVAPDSVQANTEFQVTFENGSDDQYRVYLAAALEGVTGPTCYLKNSTSLSSPVSLTIPANVGPSADYYSIAIADITTSQSSSFSNRFSFTGGTGNYTAYETHLGGAPFWDANDLPCESYSCARQCAQAGYPTDLTDDAAYETMRSCILKCPGVTPAASIQGPAHGTSSASSGSGHATTESADQALVTLGPGMVMTAIQTTVTSDGSTLTEAIFGSQTLTLGGAAATMSGQAVTLASDGVNVGSTTTVAFSSGMVTTTVADDSTSATAASASASSSAAASKPQIIAGGLAGIAGLAAALL